MTIKYVPRTVGIEDLLDDDGVRELLGKEANRVAAAARARGIHVGSGRHRQPVPIVVVVEVGKKRARAAVIVDHPAGMAIEAKYGLLRGALATVARG